MTPKSALEAYEIICSQVPRVEWMSRTMRDLDELVRAALEAAGQEQRIKAPQNALEALDIIRAALEAKPVDVAITFNDDGGHTTETFSQEATERFDEFLRRAALESQFPASPMSACPDTTASMKQHAEPVDAQERGAGLLDPNMPTQQLLLHMGEMTDSEIAVARSAIKWANSRIEPWRVELVLDNAAGHLSGGHGHMGRGGEAHDLTSSKQGSTPCGGTTQPAKPVDVEVLLKTLSNKVHALAYGPNGEDLWGGYHAEEILDIIDHLAAQWYLAGKLPHIEGLEVILKEFEMLPEQDTPSLIILKAATEYAKRMENK